MVFNNAVTNASLILKGNAFICYNVTETTFLPVHIVNIDNGFPIKLFQAVNFLQHELSMNSEY